MVTNSRRDMLTFKKPSFYCLAPLPGALRAQIRTIAVAMTTACGIVAPIASASGVHVEPELLVLATGSGSLIFSHVNDGGFWLIKEYFGMTVGQTFKT